MSTISISFNTGEVVERMNNLIYLAVLILSTTAQDTSPLPQEKTASKCGKGIMPCIMPYTVQYNLACTKRYYFVLHCQMYSNSSTQKEINSQTD